ncbi:MAG: sialidase family protein [bacterium]|nr:sialidase family protein [bacterium]
MKLLAQEGLALYESPDPASVYAYTPGLERLPSGRLLATMDQGGPGVADLPGPKGYRGEGAHAWQGRAWTSDDGGASWQPRALFPFMHARPFAAGGRVYILGHDGDLMVMASDDDGTTWGDPIALSCGQKWHQSACNVHRARGRIHLVMERRMHFAVQGWPVAELAPVLMVGAEDADLTCAGNWTFASKVSFADLGCPTHVGVPFWTLGRVAEDRTMHPPGWLETNVVEFTDPQHLWHDPTGRTLYLWMRAHTGGTGLAAIARVTEAEDGTWTTAAATAPSGESMRYVPCPGGQMRFHILFDPICDRFWLLSSLATDSMRDPRFLPAERYGLPNNERHILALHFSGNCIDWCPAGIVTRGANPGQARHYASMIIDGDDLHVLSRSGDHRARSAHDGNLITLHTVGGFRELLY